MVTVTVVDVVVVKKTGVVTVVVGGVTVTVEVVVITAGVIVVVVVQPVRTSIIALSNPNILILSFIVVRSII